VIGHDEGLDGRLRSIDFDRIKGGKAFDTEATWFTDLLGAIGQPVGVASPH
jgi:pyrophosphate--fructose-6-phosphate 1-phosphotransferase